MTPPVISVEGMSEDLARAYVDWGLERAVDNPDAINWIFGQDGQNFAVARSNGRIVGMSANIRHRMKFSGKTGIGFQAVDSFVSEEMRGQGMFLKLARAFAEYTEASEADLIWGFPNDNAAPAWFGKLGWTHHGQTPFLLKPLRSGYFLRKLGLPGDFPISRGRDLSLSPINSIQGWSNQIWDRFSHDISCATIRDEQFLNWRLFEAPHAQDYRVVADKDPKMGAIVASREMQKHGGRIAYILEAMGGDHLTDLLVSELARLRDRNNAVALAWAYPWSPNYRALRKAGFLPFPERVRPIRIWFGARPVSPTASVAQDRRNWYLSYLDSDTV